MAVACLWFSAKTCWFAHTVDPDASNDVQMRRCLVCMTALQVAGTTLPMVATRGPQ